MQSLAQYPVSVIIFVITIITTLYAFSNEVIYGKFLLHPYSIWRKREVYTVFTSGLIHKDWMHLIFNMFSYYFFAFNLETVLGHWQFALLYIVSLILSDLPSVYKHRDDYSYHSLGASGAISAVIFSSIMFFPMSKMMIIPFPFEIPAIIFGVLYLVYCTYASKYSRDAINHDAHLFGALSGVLITIALYPQVVPLFWGQISVVVQSYFH
jgi:membrane associated rhomboid family serine protease